MTDYAAARRARANALDAARNHYAIAESRFACLPHAARQIEECVEIDGHLFFVPGIPITPHAAGSSPEKGPAAPPHVVGAQHPVGRQLRGVAVESSAMSDRRAPTTP